MEAEKSKSAESGKTGRVLVVDDDEDFVDMTGEALEMLGFDVIISKSGKSAVETYRTRMKEIDIVMLDMTLPEMNGAEIFHAIRSLDPAAKIVLCSGFSQDEGATTLLDEGAKGYVQKPFKLADLSTAFTKIINGG